MPKNKLPLVYYTDGSCGSKDRIGGWSAVRMVPLIRAGWPMDALVNARAAGYDDTTISRMELSGVIAALLDARTYNIDKFQIFGHEPRQVIITTDSEYVQKGFMQHLEGWFRNGGKKANGEPVANFDLWVYAKALKEATKAEIRWVKGHAGNLGNEAADKLAGEQRQAVLAVARSGKHDPAVQIKVGDWEWLEVHKCDMDAMLERVPKKSLF